MKPKKQMKKLDDQIASLKSANWESLDPKGMTKARLLRHFTLEREAEANKIGRKPK